MEHSKEEQLIINEIQKEILDNDPVYKRCRLVTFLSESSGRGKKRKPREVQLLIIDEKYAYQIVNGEIKGRRDKTAPDILALEILTHLPSEERTAETLLTKASKISLL